MTPVSSIGLVLCLVGLAQGASLGGRYQAGDVSEEVLRISRPTPIHFGRAAHIQRQRQNDILKRFEMDGKLKDDLGEEIDLNFLAATQTSPAPFHSKPLDNVNDQQIDAYTETTVARLNDFIESATSIRKTILFLRFLAVLSGEQEDSEKLKLAETEAKRLIVNAKMTVRIVTELYNSSGKVVDSSVDSTEFEEKRQLISGLVGRLEPVPCQKEFIADVLEYGTVRSRIYPKCMPSDIYDTEWYQGACRAVNAAEDEEENNELLCTGSE